LLDTIKDANDLKELIMKHREKTGTLDFDFPETVVEFDEN
jgi:exoribonuclease R